MNFSFASVGNVRAQSDGNELAIRLAIGFSTLQKA
jgi:hypothetical protein